MGTLINQIKNSIQELVATMQPIIDFHISVVDENVLRVVGTGEYEKYIGLKLPPGTSNDYVVKTGKFLKLYNPLEHEVCEMCPIRNICLQETMLIYPIKMNEKVIGAITIAAFEDRQKKKIKEKEEQLYLFLKNLSSFISSKAKEFDTSNQISAVFNTVDEGVILTDYKGRITAFNEVAEKMFFRKFNQDLLIQELNTQLDPYELFQNGNNKANNEINLGKFYGDKNIMVSTKLVQKNWEKTDILFTFKEKHDDFEGIPLQSTIEQSEIALSLENIKGEAPTIKKTKKLAIKASQTTSNVLIRGESGTGKELFAQAIHELSERRDNSFITVNCATLPEDLIESELFGYEEGAFTGAKKGGKLGKFELADGGTLFLDEIGDLPFHIQPKLLRAIEYGSIEKIGGTKSVKVNTRIVAATNLNLEKMIEENKFREDLYYRLNVIPIDVPPLRKRKEDILFLANHFLMLHSKRVSKKINAFSDEVETAFLVYNWPGNVRELENIVEYAVHLEESNIIQYNSLPQKLNLDFEKKNRKRDHWDIKYLELSMIDELLKEHGDSLEGKKKIAKLMGISLSTLYRRLKEQNS